MFSPVELELMRAQQAAALPDMATITRLVRAYDDTGGFVEQASVVAANVACRVTREKPREVTQGDRTVVLADWVVTLPHGTDVRPNDDITVGSQRLHVVGLLTGSWRTCERALCTGVA